MSRLFRAPRTAAWGFDDPCFNESIEHMMGWRTRQSSEQVSDRASTARRLERENSVSIEFLTRRDGGHAPVSDRRRCISPLSLKAASETPSGKGRVVQRKPQESGARPPSPPFIPPIRITPTRRKQKKYPLEILTRKSDNHLNSSFCNLPTHPERWRSRALPRDQRPTMPSMRNIREGRRPFASSTIAAAFN